MNQATSFVISKFTNPSGEVVFRVTGNLDDQRVRKNFLTRGKDTTPAGFLLAGASEAETNDQKERVSRALCVDRSRVGANDRVRFHVHLKEITPHFSYRLGTLKNLQRFGQLTATTLIDVPRVPSINHTDRSGRSRRLWPCLFAIRE